MSAEEAKEEGAAQDLEEPAEECPTCSPPLPPPPPSEPETGSQCQSWLLELLDDVRYLISCTNWY